MIHKSVYRGQARHDRCIMENIDTKMEKLYNGEHENGQEDYRMPIVLSWGRHSCMLFRFHHPTQKTPLDDSLAGSFIPWRVNVVKRTTGREFYEVTL